MKYLVFLLTLLFSVSLTAQVLNVGRIVGTKRVSYTPVLDSLLVNTTANAAKWWRINDTLYIEGGFTMSGSGTGAESVTIALPSGLVIDTAKLSTGTAAANGTGPVLGNGHWFQSGTGWLFLVPTYATTTTIRFYMNSQVLAASQLLISDGVHYEIHVPIVGW